MRALSIFGIAALMALTTELCAQQTGTPGSATERMRLAAADSAYNDGDRLLAQRYYASVLEVNPKNSRAVYQLGQLARENPIRAIGFFRQYVALEPGDAWGHIALAQALAREGALDEALREMAAAQRIAPAERDVWVGRARILAQTNRTDAAIVQYERWTTTHPDDAEAWRELSAQRAKAGRIDGAIRALEQAQARHATPAAERRLARLRAMAAPWTEPIASGSRDSDGNQTGRIGLMIGAALGAVTLDGHGTATHVTAPGDASSVYDAGVGARWRPSAALRTEARAGLALADAVVAGAQQAQPIGELRLDWRDPGGMATLGIRASRALVTASPTLVRNNVVRDEVGGRADLTVVGPLRVRALARDGLITSAIDNNNRLSLGGGAVLAGSIGELSVIAQQITFAHASAAGYFAPRSARLAELGTYAELESDGGVRLSFDIGGGAQQVTKWGLPTGSWGPAYHTWAELALPLADASELRFELESYDSRISEVATSGTWRYLSLAASVHWALH